MNNLLPTINYSEIMQVRFLNELLSNSKTWSRYFSVLPIMFFYFSVFANFDGGDGTAGNPYLISTFTQLNSMRNFPNTAHYKLTANINASSSAGLNGGLGWEPLPIYNGTFDGDGFTISDLTINRPSTTNTGMYSVLNGTAVIKNVSLVNVSIVGGDNTGAIAGTANAGSSIQQITISGSISGQDYVGGLLGINQGNISESTSSGIVSGGSYIGGFVGYNNQGTIFLSYATGNVFATGTRSGGFAGVSSGPLTNVYARGNVTGGNFQGGLVGRNENGSIITNAYSTGSVWPGGGNRGGLVGFNQTSVNNSFWDTETSGFANSAGGTGRTTAQMKNQINFTDAGWDFTTIWGMDPGINDGYPHLQVLQVPPGNIWTGAINTEWHNTANWNTNQVPGAGGDVTILVTSNNPLISTNGIEVANIVIESGASLTIGSTGNLTVSAAITNNTGINGLLIASDSAGTGSLIQTGNNVSATFQRYVTGLPEAWHLLSAPVQGQEFSPAFTPAGTYGDGTGYDLYAWHEPDTQWTYYLNNTQAPTWQVANGSNNFFTGRGYLIAYQDTNPTFDFLGVLHLGNIDMPITKTTGDGDEFGFNLVGNPYPSSIDWKASSGWNRTNLNNQDGGYDIWMWNDAAFNYGVYNSASASDNGTLNVGRYIAPTQGFFVMAATSGNLAFSDDIRVHQGAGNWLKPMGPVESLEITIQNSDAGGYDQVRVEFGHTGAYKGSAKKFSFIPQAPSLYVPLGYKEYSIRMLSDKMSFPVLPLSFKAGVNGSYTINIAFDRDLFEYLILEDLQLGLEHDLREDPAYTFQSEIKDDAARFVLKFRPGNFANPHHNLPARIYGYNGSVYADLSIMETGARFELFDLSGKRIYSSILLAGQTHQIPMQVSGLFIGRLSNQDGILVEKVFF